jgi:hypothetical protein
MRDLLRRLPYPWRRRFRRSNVGYLLHADRWLP